ncbi:MAG TPA: DUF4349 domain-containing protein [Allosphingosinicella sp.]|nr:DUF4349 domain-containing protein [Allosphingosinicella sp.]
MRRSIPLLVLFLATAAGCGQAGGDGNRPSGAPTGPTANSSASDLGETGAIPPELPAPRAPAERGIGPDVDTQAAPGVAFDYRYAFRLAADRIAGMQREHQQLCARYGSRCRVTGVDYRAANEEDVEATLSFLVDPEIAAQFGRESVRAVTAADGDVTESAVNGTDVGTPLKLDEGRAEELRAELGRVEARLARPDLRAAERARLDEQRQSLRQQIAALDETTSEREQALAATPIHFRYGSGAFAPGPGRGPTLGEATTRAADNFLGALKTLLIFLVSISPWALTGLLLWLGFRAVRKRRSAAPAPSTDA